MLDGAIELSAQERRQVDSTGPELAPAMPSVLEINDIDQLADYRLLWNSLLSQTDEATFFQSLDWLEVYWRHFGAGSRLRVLVASAADGPIGILPLVIQSESTGVGNVRVLTYPLDGWGSFFGPIGPNPTATLLVGMKHIANTERDWDLLDLRWVDSLGHDHGRTGLAMEMAGFEPRRQAWMRGAVVDTSGTWEDYWNGRSKQRRRNVRRIRRRLAEEGHISHVRYRPEGKAAGDGEPRWDLWEACLGVARRSWQAASTTGTTLCHESIEPYLRDTHARAAKAGGVDLNLLMLDDRPAAFCYNYVYRGNVYALRAGFDQDLTELRPGTMLTRLMLEDSFRRGDRLFDFGPGSLDCKRHWQTSNVTSYRYTHFPKSVPRAQLLRLKRWLQDRLYDDDAIAIFRSA